MKNWTSEYVDTNGIKIHYWRTGGDKPPIVLCHGFSDNGMCWKRAALVLEADYDLIMMDARGHGLSDTPKSGFENEDRAADTAGLIETLGLKGAAIMGHSMGAGTMSTVAALYPDLVSCAVLEDPGWQSYPEATLNAAWREERREELKSHKSRTHGQIKEWCRKAHPEWDEIELDVWADAKEQLNLRVLDFLGPLPDWRDTVDAIRCPTLVIAADPSKGALVDEEVAAEVQERNRKIKVARLDGAGHNIRREAFEPFIAVVQEFLKDHYPG